jgi:hypothetical protein
MRKSRWRNLTILLSNVSFSDIRILIRADTTKRLTPIAAINTMAATEYPRNLPDTFKKALIGLDQHSYLHDWNLTPQKFPSSDFSYCISRLQHCTVPHSA